MIAALCSAAAVLVLGAMVRPRPPARCPEPAHAAKPDSTDRRSRFRLRRPVRPDRSGDAAETAAWCESLARVVRGGSTLVTAICTVEPPDRHRATTDRITLALERGRRLGETLDVESPSPHLTLALSVLRACAVNGGPPAEPLDRAAATLRSRAVAAAERRTQSAQARMSAVVMTVLPIAMLLLLLATSATTRHAATSPVGLIALATGGALNVVGWRWMRRIIDGRPT